MQFEELATRYTGNMAQNYNAERKDSADWTNENIIIEDFMAHIPRGAAVIDIPVGTGRFMEFYKRHQLIPTGFDISDDMLAAAREAAAHCGIGAQLKKGDIRKINAPDKSFEAGLCIRFVNWIDFEGFKGAIAELDRVVRSILIVTVRVQHTPRTLLEKLRQRWKAFSRRNAKLHLHNQDAVEAVFKAHGFQIAELRIVRQRRDKSTFQIYLLKRETA